MSTVRVCAISDVECSRGCGAGACKKEGEAMNYTAKDGKRNRHPQSKGLTDAVEEYDAALENMIGCFDDKVDEYVKRALTEARAIIAALQPTAEPGKEGE